MIDDSLRPLKVFLCYASSDKQKVKRLYSRLHNDGIDAWLDKEKLIPGQEWQIEIPKAVRNSDVVIVCLSSKSINKDGYIQKEIKFALDAADEKPEGAIFIIPARLENCDIPGRINQYHWVDLFANDGYERLVRALQVRALQVRANSLNVELKSSVKSTNLHDNLEATSSFQSPVERKENLEPKTPVKKKLNLEAENNYDLTSSDAIQLLDQFPPLLDEYFRDANEIFMVGITLRKTTYNHYDDFISKAKSGLKIQALIINPYSRYVDMKAVANSYSQNDPPHVFASQYDAIFERYKLIRDEANQKSNIQVRLLDFMPPFNAYIFPQKRDGGIVFVQMYVYKPPIGHTPYFFVTQRQNPLWYERFCNLYEEMWDDAMPYFSDSEY